MPTVIVSVIADNDDVARRLGATAYWDRTGNSWYVGAFSDTSYQWGLGFRFLNVTIPQGATIASAKITIEGDAASTGSPQSRISAEDVDNAGAIADDGAAFDTRWAARTTARVDWDNDSHGGSCAVKDSPDITSVIQEIVTRGGWLSGNAILIFWDDFEDRTAHASNYYKPAMNEDPTCNPAKLTVVYSTGWTGKIAGVTNPAKVMGVDVANIAKVKGVA